MCSVCPLDPCKSRDETNAKHPSRFAYLEPIQDRAARECCKTRAYQQRACKALGYLLNHDRLEHAMRFHELQHVFATLIPCRNTKL